jgi:phosphoenolpyruvate carboxykinase (ATP)
MQYNTGGMGEIIQTSEVDGKQKKQMIRKVSRVPIDLMAKIQRGDLRDTNDYEMGPLGAKRIVKAEGQSLDQWDIRRYYSEEQIQNYIHELVEGRRAFTEEIAEEGLRDEVLSAAERSFRISKSPAKATVPGPEEEQPEEPEYRTWDSKVRPRRDRFYRSR